jgi:hypothetical protein
MPQPGRGLPDSRRLLLLRRTHPAGEVVFRLGRADPRVRWTGRGSTRLVVARGCAQILRIGGHDGSTQGLIKVRHRRGRSPLVRSSPGGHRRSEVYRPFV